MPCQLHRSRKKGDCISCGGCKLCKPAKGCQCKEIHKTNTKRGRPASVVAKENKRKKSKTLNQNEKRPQRAAAAVAITRLRDNYDPLSDSYHDNADDDDDETISVEAYTFHSNDTTTLIETGALLDALSPASFTSNETLRERKLSVDSLQKNRDFPIKQKLIKLLLILGIPLDCDAEKFPREGFTTTMLSDPSSRACRRARRLRSILNKKIDELLCPSDPNVWNDILNPYKQMKKSMQNNLENDIINLALTGHAIPSMVANCILVSTYHRLEIQNLFKKAFELNNKLPATRYIIGRKRFRSLKKKLKTIVQGNELLMKREYTFRVSPDKMISALSFLQNSLQVRPGAIRSVTFAGHSFNGLPVYSRGGVNIDSLHETYKFSLGGVNALGLNIFGELTKLLTSRGQIKTGLSTYYVRLKYVSSLYLGMLERLQEIDGVASKPGFLFKTTPDDLTKNTTIKDDCEALITKWRNMMQFLSYQFSEQHLQINSVLKVLCCTYSVNKNYKCLHFHEQKQCRLSLEALTSMDPFESILNYLDIQNNEELDAEIIYEVASMKKTIPIIKNQVKNYMSHRMRAKIQFTAINKVYAELNSNNALLVFDHKQKVLPRQHREGQVDYFGKRGMSLIGCMLVKRIEKEMRGEKLFGLEYQYIDCMMQQYSAQDSVQVLACIQVVIKFVKEKYPNIISLTLQSDNASCFASHDNIPYLYHLNKEMKEEMNMNISVDRWIYTEAQTGKGKLDTHFSFVNVLFDSYVEDGNDILTERDIFRALTFQGGIMGSSAILMDGSTISSNKKVLKKAFKSKRIGVRETHDIIWNVIDDTVEIYTLSDITDPEHVFGPILDHSFQKNNIFVNILSSFTSDKTAMFVPDTPVVKDGVANQQPTDIKMGSKVSAIVSGLEQAGIQYNLQRNASNEIDKVDDAEAYPIEMGWACYPKSHKSEMLSVSTLQVLKDLFDGGIADKSKKVSADRAHVVITEQIALRDWYERSICTVARVKAFYALSPKKMSEMIEKSLRYELELDRLSEVEVLQESEQVAQEYETNQLTMVENGNNDVRVNDSLIQNVDENYYENNKRNSEEENEILELEEIENEMVREMLTAHDVDFLDE